MDLADFAGADPLAVTVAGTLVDNASLAPVVIHHGRPSPEVRPDASTASFACYTTALPTFPTVGDAVTIEYSTALIAAAGLTEASRRRFTGRITDVDILPSRDVAAIVATGPLARASRVAIGDTPWPAESDGARASRILGLIVAADASQVLGTVDPGTVTVLARDVDRQPAGVLLEELAAYTGGETWQTRGGALRYTDAGARGTVTVSFALDASDVLADAQWQQSVDGLLSDLTVGYGAPDPVTGLQATTRVVDAVASSPVTGPGMGPLAAIVGTPLAALVDAAAYARLTVGRRAWPRWRVPALTVDMIRTLGDDIAGTTARAALAEAEPGALLALTAMPTDAPDVATQMWLEGWTETIAARAWRMTLAISPRGLTGPGMRWVDVPPSYRPEATAGGTLPDLVALTWANVAAAAGYPPTWLTSAGWWPPATTTLDRWADQPADVLWSSFPDSTHWSDLP